MLRFVLFLIGFGFLIIGNIYIISYLNLLTLGYNFFEYVKFIISRIECMLCVIGLIIIILVVYIPKEDNNELCV